MSESITGLEAGGLFPRLQERYGLSSDPLAQEVPFYPGAQRQHALETLRHLCGFGDLALVLTGARGAGKTRLLGELVRSEGGRLEFLRLHAGKLDSVESLVRTLYQGLGRQWPEGQSAREALASFMALSKDATRKGRRQVLLVDDADQASQTALTALLEAFSNSDRSAVAIPVLAGGPELTTQLGLTVDSRMASQVHIIGLPAFDSEDIRQYLEPRIIRAGGKPDDLLSPRRLNQLNALSQGSPGRLQRIAPAVWLDMASATGQSARAASKRLSPMRWLALALLLLGASWWFVSTRYADAVAQAPAPAREREPPSRAGAAVAPGPAQEEEPPAVPDPVEARAPEEEGGPEDEAGPVHGTGPAPDSSPEPEPENRFDAAMPERFVPKEDVNARPGYTVQLVAGYQESTAVDFIRQYRELEGLRYTQSERKGQDWFVVYIGQFDSRDAARASAEELPSSIRSLGPWIRPFEEI